MKKLKFNVDGKITEWEMVDKQEFSDYETLANEVKNHTDFNSVEKALKENEELLFAALRLYGVGLDILNEERVEDDMEELTPDEEIEKLAEYIQDDFYFMHSNGKIKENISIIVE